MIQAMLILSEEYHELRHAVIFLRPTSTPIDAVNQGNWSLSLK